MVRTFFALLLMLSPPSKAVDIPVKPNKCLVIYYLDGLAYDAFALQVDNMRAQLISKKIALIDLRHWQSEPPFQHLSGRNRRLLRQQLGIEANVSQAVLLDRKGQIRHYKGTIDLIDFLFACR